MPGDVEQSSDVKCDHADTNAGQFFSTGEFKLGVRNPEGFLGSPQAGVASVFDTSWIAKQRSLPADSRKSADSATKTPVKLRGTKSLGGILTESVGKSDDRREAVPVAYRHGSNITLHRWDDCLDVLVSCQSQQQESLIDQQSITSGAVSWSVDVTRTCDMLWVGITVNPTMDCEEWIGAQPGTYMISEEFSMLTSVYEQHGRENPSEDVVSYPSLSNYTASRDHLMLTDCKQAGLGGIWCSVALTLDMIKGELWLLVDDGSCSGYLPEEVLIFHSLPTHQPMYPCLSLCNAGQVVLRKHAFDLRAVPQAVKAAAVSPVKW